MTDTTAGKASTPASVTERILFGLRQSALIAVALLIAGLVTERLRPAEVFDRGIASTPFLWAIVAWLIVLVFHAIAFEHSQTATLEGPPLVGALIVAAFVFVAGLISLDGGIAARRVIYLLANSLGAVMFWWAIFSLVALFMRRIGDEPATN